MPIYEYRCNGCGRRVQLLFRSFSAVADPKCSHCGSADLNRLPSRVSSVRSDTAYQNLLDDPSALENVDYENPSAVAEWARRMGEAAGVDMGQDYDEMLHEIEQGGGIDDVADDDGFEDASDYSTSDI